MRNPRSRDRHARSFMHLDFAAGHNSIFLFIVQLQVSEFAFTRESTFSVFLLPFGSFAFETGNKTVRCLAIGLGNLMPLGESATSQIDKSDMTSLKLIVSNGADYVLASITDCVKRCPFGNDDRHADESIRAGFLSEQRFKAVPRTLWLKRCALILIGLTWVQSGFPQSTVHRFGALTSKPDRSFTLELLGSPPAAFLHYYDLYPLETSTNLVNWTSWQTIVRTNLNTNSPVCLDAAA